MSTKVLYCPGRFGDCINFLPLAWMLHQQGHKVHWFVAKDFAGLFDGFSYVELSIWDNWYSHQSKGLAECRRRFPDAEIINCQAHNNADKRQLTPSYQTEGWRLAGFLEEFGKHPLVFDRRDSAREQKLLRQLGLHEGEPFILCGLHGHSSPLTGANAILRELSKEFRVVDLQKIKAERVYDLLAVMEKAALIVSADSVLLHLARACETPMVALLNSGWAGSVSPGSTLQAIRYPEATAERVMEAVRWVSGEGAAA